MSDIKKTLYYQWRHNGLTDLFRGVIAAHREFKDIDNLTIIPQVHDNNKFCDVFPWVHPVSWWDWTVHPGYIDVGIWRHNSPYIKSIRDMLQNQNSVSIAGLLNDYNDSFRDVGEFKWLYSLKPEIQSIIDARINAIVTGDYEVIHTRMHWDDATLAGGHGATIPTAIAHLNNIAENTNTPTVLLSDSMDILSSAPSCFLRSGIRPVHSFRHGADTSIETVLDVLTDLWLIIRSKKVTSLTIFPWGSSGFSHLACSVWGIPYSSFIVENGGITEVDLDNRIKEPGYAR